MVGTGIANRRWPGSEEIVGMLINNVAIRTDLSGDPSFDELVSRVRASALEAYDHQDVPFDQVVRAVNPKRLAGVSPLFQTLFTLYDGEVPELELPGIDIELTEGINNGTSKFDLNTIVISRPAGSPDDGLIVIWEFNTEVFRIETMRRMLAHYRHLLQQVVEQPEARISELSMLDEKERDLVVQQWSGGSSDYPREAGLATLFQQQSGRTPEAVAIQWQEQTLSYAELNSKANRLARFLRQQGVERGDLVGICMQRNANMIVSTLAALKAGAAYLPLDPDYPSQRLRYMIDDAAAKVVLTDAESAPTLPSTEAIIVDVDLKADQIEQQPETDLDELAGGSDPAYVMYTSGSSGTPKGVVATQRGVSRLVCDTNYVQLGPDETLLQLAPISFDAATFEIWGSLLNGARLVLSPSGLSPAELADLIQHEQITTLWLTAALFHEIVDQHLEKLSGVRQLLAGGDVLSVPHVEKVLQALGPDQVLINGYGPTENTTFTCCHVMNRESRIGRSVPIGTPISNSRVFILDQHQQPVPVGVPGELFIGGDGLAAGYWNAPELTQQKFVWCDVAQQTLYRSGDRCRWLNDGSIEFLGRLDQQVKIRGFRVEPGEIEDCLMAIEEVGQAAVLVSGEQDKRIVAFVAGSRSSLSERALRDQLRTVLPSYMIPTEINISESLPQTPTGKLDRSALASSKASSKTPSSPPANKLERRIAGIWEAALKTTIGRDDDFFERGGHSLLWVSIAARLEKELGARVPLSTVFNYPTVAEQAALIAASAGECAIEETAAPRERGVL